MLGLGSRTAWNFCLSLSAIQVLSRLVHWLAFHIAISQHYLVRFASVGEYLSPSQSTKYTISRFEEFPDHHDKNADRLLITLRFSWRSRTGRPRFFDIILTEYPVKMNFSMNGRWILLIIVLFGCCGVNGNPAGPTRNRRDAPFSLWNWVASKFGYKSIADRSATPKPVVLEELDPAVNGESILNQTNPTDKRPLIICSWNIFRFGPAKFSIPDLLVKQGKNFTRMDVIVDVSCQSILVHCCNPKRNSLSRINTLLLPIFSSAK